MSLYFVRHQHSAETCPAKDPEMGQMLLQHLTKTNARKFGVDLIGDAVLDSQHTLVLIAEAEDRNICRITCSHLRRQVRWRSCRPPRVRPVVAAAGLRPSAPPTAS